MNIRATLKRPSYLVLTIILTLVFIVLYGFFDLREGGRHTTLFTTHIQPPQFYILHFGAWYFWSLVVLDVLTSLFSAILIALTVANYRNRSSMFTGTACSTVATLGLGIATFGQNPALLRPGVQSTLACHRLRHVRMAAPSPQSHTSASYTGEGLNGRYVFAEQGGFLRVSLP